MSYADDIHQCLTVSDRDTVLLALLRAIDRFDETGDVDAFKRDIQAAGHNAECLAFGEHGVHEWQQRAEILHSKPNLKELHS